MFRTDLEGIAQSLRELSPQLIDRTNLQRRAAVAIIFRENFPQNKTELMFIRRAELRDDPWSGHMAFPGGREEPDDRNRVETAVRETREEVDLDLKYSGRFLGQLDDLMATVRGRVIPMTISPCVFALTRAADARPDQVEVEEVHWIPVDALLSDAHRSKVDYQYGGQPITLPCYRINNRVIWGLTYQMLMMLFLALGWSE